MNDDTFYDETSQLFLLCTIELCASVFRGMSDEDCTLLCREGLADLHPLYAADKGKLTDLCEAVAALERFANTYAEDLGGFCKQVHAEFIHLFGSDGDVMLAPALASFYEPILSHCDHDASIEPEESGQGRAVIRMQSLLAEVGLSSRPTSGEPPDHISTQLEYLYFLLSTGWRDGDAAARHKATLFVRTEMQPWVSIFAEALDTHNRNGLYSACASVLVAILAYVAE